MKINFCNERENFIKLLKRKKKKMLQKKLKEMFEFLNLYVPKTNLKSVTIAAS